MLIKAFIYFFCSFFSEFAWKSKIFLLRSSENVFIFWSRNIKIHYEQSPGILICLPVLSPVWIHLLLSLKSGYQNRNTVTISVVLADSPFIKDTNLDRYEMLALCIAWSETGTLMLPRSTLDQREEASLYGRFRDVSQYICTRRYICLEEKTRTKCPKTC